MCYMMSKQGYLNDAAGHWKPHVMFFEPLADPEGWGSGLDGVPLIGVKDAEDHLTIIMVPVAKWSDGSPAS